VTAVVKPTEVRGKPGVREVHVFSDGKCVASAILDSGQLTRFAEALRRGYDAIVPVTVSRMSYISDRAE